MFSQQERNQYFAIRPPLPLLVIYAYRNIILQWLADHSGILPASTETQYRLVVSRGLTPAEYELVTQLVLPDFSYTLLLDEHVLGDHLDAFTHYPFPLALDVNKMLQQVIVRLGIEPKAISGGNLVDECISELHSLAAIFGFEREGVAASCRTSDEWHIYFCRYPQEEFRLVARWAIECLKTESPWWSSCMNRCFGAATPIVTRTRLQPPGIFESGSSWQEHESWSEQFRPKKPPYS